MQRWFERTNDTVHDEQNIKGFFGDYRWLSNFEVCIIKYKGCVFTSTEAAYQAMKCKNSEDIIKFQGIGPSESKKLGKTVELRSNWDEIKDSIMYEILTIKFQDNPELKQKLLLTGEKYLEETNWWGDKYWGVCKEVGRNILGHMLMKIRKELNNE